MLDTSLAKPDQRPAVCLHPEFTLQAQEQVREIYRRNAAEYRRDDEIEVRTDHHCWIWKTLADLSSSFGRPITILDVGCGTGRHFHCLENVRRLVGLDISPEMLAMARTPIRQELVSAEEIDLVSGSAHSADFPPGSFDFIYSIGMFGYGCELRVEVLNRFYDWLSPDGKLFFDISDWSGMPLKARLRKTAKKVMCPVLPEAVQRHLDEREQNLRFFPLTRRQLSRVIRKSAFGRCEIYRRPCHSPCWGVAKLECLTARTQLSPGLIESLQFRVAATASALHCLTTGLMLNGA
jgi:SAM-dependent methyltransferase